MPEGVFITVLGNDYYLSNSRMPWFRMARAADIFSVKMLGDYGIRWDKLDVDLEIESLKHPEQYPLVMKRTVAETL